MNTNEWLHRRLPLLALLLSLVLFVLSMASGNPNGNTEAIAKTTGSRIGKRIEILDRHIEQAKVVEDDEYMTSRKLPEDMVIYRYVNDTLQSWNNQFSIINDDIASRMVFQTLTDRKSRIVSYLTDVKEHFSYMNLGPKWYLIKSVQAENNVRLIAGIEIKNTLIEDVRRNDNGVNPKLKLSGKYSVLPLHYSGGSAVEIDGVPLFKVIYDSTKATPFFDNSMLRWIAILLLAAAQKTNMAKFKRILLKLSGESLMGEQRYGIDEQRLGEYAAQIKEIHDMGVQIGIVIGGGNIFRGLTGAGKGFDRVKGDQMGMLATVINSLALSSALTAIGVKARVLTAIRMEPIGELYTKWKAIDSMEAGEVVILSGGTGNPYFTTDTGSSLRGIEIEADVMLKGTRVDGIYTADPEKDPTATKFSEITYDEIYTRGLKVMDLTATTMCKQNNLPIYVFNMDIVGNLKKVMEGEPIGTYVHN